MNVNENNEVVFPYQVNTIMPITGLSIGNIMVPSTVKLTKGDVEICLRKAPTFRRFQNGKLVRVTLSSIDRLHNEKFMNEKEYEEYIDKLEDNRGKVEAFSVSMPNEGEIAIDKNPPSMYEEIKKEIPVTELNVEEADTAKDEIVDQTEVTADEVTVEDVNDEGISEEVTEDSVSTDDQNKNDYNNHNGYKNKKKHNR